MGDSTKIPYVDHTWNPWYGCEPVHTGCQNCYAKPYWKRFHVPPGRRKRAAESTLLKPFAWNRRAAKLGVRRRVMLGSLMDFFEDHPDVGEWRKEVFEMIRDTPHLDWVIPTKRPERLPLCWPSFTRNIRPNDFSRRPYQNVSVLVSVSDQATYKRADRGLFPSCTLLDTSVGLSIEPLLGPIDLGENASVFDWLVIGGESGDNARPCHVEWIRDLAKQGQAADIAVYIKQLGSAPVSSRWSDIATMPHIKDSKGADPDEWPSDLRIQEYPKTSQGET